MALFAAAMAWVTHRMLRMERDRQSAEVESQTQEHMRLALWRMDALVSALINRENARPPEQYLPFHSPAALYLNRSQAAVPQGEAVTPSPLLGEPPEFVHLHFELMHGTCTSPQVPTGNDLALASNWYAITPQLDAAKAKLTKVNAMIAAQPSALGGVPIKSSFDDRSKDTSQSEVPASPSSQTFANSQDMQKRATTLQQNAAPAPAAPPMKKEAPQQARTTPPPTDLRPVWLDGELLFVRDATLDGTQRTQGLWLDWPLLRGRLIDTVKDLLPYARLVPTQTRLEDATSLVTLPAKLLPGPLPTLAVESFPLGRMMLIAWACFIVAAIAAGIVLHRAMVLSERRGAFVSAVTHELRTPLTTFRLYSEMLADDMVPDPERRREYLQTLASESTRLTHLVENVLCWSRIERGRASARMERTDVGVLIERCEPRLRQRAMQAQLELEVTLPTNAAELIVETDTSAVEQILFNLVDNACKYAAPACEPRTLRIAAVHDEQQVYIYVIDHGPGVPERQLKRLFQPFEKSAMQAAHSAPGVGLGLALSRRLARELRGDLEWQSSEVGATFVLTLPRASDVNAMA